MGFDFYLYINGNGEIYEDSWKFTEDGQFSPRPNGALVPG